MRNSRCLIMNVVFLLALLIASSAAGSVWALPTVVKTNTANAASLTQRGQAVMRFFGLKVYDIRLWTPMKPHTHDEIFALELVYDISLKGSEIARRSVIEMRKIGYTDEAKLIKWGETMAAIFPDVKKGDTLVGVSIPGKEARFYSQEKFIASVADAEFAQAFFDIWLSEKTSEPKLRTRLLGNL